MPSKKFVRSICVVAALVMLVGTAQVVQAANTPQEEANKSLVADFYSALSRADEAGHLRDEIRTIAEQYIAPDYIQHNEMAARAGNGREGLIQLLLRNSVQNVTLRRRGQVPLPLSQLLTSMT